MVLAALAAAEQWADEPVAPPEPPPKVSSPRVGLVAGVHLGLPGSYVAPDVGVRSGVRLRVGEHAALSLFADLDLVWLDDPQHPPTQSHTGEVTPAPVILAQRLAGFARLELISSSASSVMLVPKLTAGLYFGAGVGLVPGEVADGYLSGGLHLGITRLDPSGWWFPVSLDLGLEGSPLGGGLFWRLLFGVGI